MLGAPNRVKRKSPGGLLGCVFPIALLVVLIALLSFLSPTLNLGDKLGFYILGAVVLVLLVAGYLWVGPKDLLVTTAVLVGLAGACFLLCTALFLLNNATATTSTGGFVPLLTH